MSLQNSANILRSQPVSFFGGECIPPGDKSITQRAFIFAALATGTTSITHFLPSADCLHTAAALQACGVPIKQVGTDVQIQGLGLNGLQAPNQDLHLGNSGTGFRLLAGILAAQPFITHITGDLSLQRRPMARILDPLQKMGACIQSENSRAPFTIYPAALSALTYELPVASAQVKSCLLLAGLAARQTITLKACVATRDHTERLLYYYGLPLKITKNQLTLLPVKSFLAKPIHIPGDFSSAAFFIAFCAGFPKMSLKVTGVGLNTLRIGLLSVLIKMGASIQWGIEQEQPEPVGWIQIIGKPLKGIEIPKEWVASCIDEFPAIWLAASFATGVTVVRGASELRIKESDRIEAMATGLEAVGIGVERFEDGLAVTGGVVRGGMVNSQGDHRIAMAFLMMGARSECAIDVADCDCIGTSFPDFSMVANSLGLQIEERVV